MREMFVRFAGGARLIAVFLLLLVVGTFFALLTLLFRAMIAVFLLLLAVGTFLAYFFRIPPRLADVVRIVSVLLLLAVVARVLVFLYFTVPFGPSAPVSAGTTEVGSSPARAESLVVEAIDRAKKTVLVAASADALRSKPMVQALVRAARRGVDVRIVITKSQAHDLAASASFLASAHIPVRMDAQHALPSDRFLVVNGGALTTGRYDAMLVIDDSAGGAVLLHAPDMAILLRDMPSVAQESVQEWNRLWNESRPFST
jgi:hypothetical protein